MNKILVTMAALSALSIGMPAAAQYPTPRGGHQTNAFANGNLSARIHQLHVRFEAGLRDGSINRREAVSLRQQLRQLTQLERRYSRNGISGRERADLQQRMQGLRQQIRTADGGNQARWDRYDREDGYGRWDRSGREYGGYDDGYYSRDGGYYDRDGNWDYGTDDRYQQPARGGLGGMVDALLGTGGLQVGQQAPANLYGVPEEYRAQYRDSSNVYYRSDGRQIYGIDARTRTVARVYAMNR